MIDKSTAVFRFFHTADIRCSDIPLLLYSGIPLLLYFLVWFGFPCSDVPLSPYSGFPLLCFIAAFRLSLAQEELLYNIDCCRYITKLYRSDMARGTKRKLEEMEQEVHEMKNLVLGTKNPQDKQS